MLQSRADAWEISKCVSDKTLITLHVDMECDRRVAELIGGGTSVVAAVNFSDVLDLKLLSAVFIHVRVDSLDQME